MNLEDEKNTIFVTNRGTYYFRVMPFSLKYTGVTYQCLVNKVLKYQIDHNMQVHVDDMLVKSEKADHIANLGETFNNLRLH